MPKRTPNPILKARTAAAKHATAKTPMPNASAAFADSRLCKLEHSEFYAAMNKAPSEAGYRDAQSLYQRASYTELPIAAYTLVFCGVQYFNSLTTTTTDGAAA